MNRLLGKAKIGESFAIGLADELICALHQTLPLLEPLDPIDQLFGCVGIIAEDGAVRFSGCGAPSIIFSFIVVFLGLRKMLIDALEVRLCLFSE